jgi:hypothetical protein
MCYRLLFCRSFASLYAGRSGIAGEFRADQRAATLGIAQDEVAAMVFQNLSDNRESQPRAFLSGCYIGFDQFIAPFGR